MMNEMNRCESVFNAAYASYSNRRKHSKNTAAAANRGYVDIICVLGQKPPGITDIPAKKKNKYLTFFFGCDNKKAMKVNITRIIRRYRCLF
jgi:hypothetical protein